MAGDYVFSFDTAAPLSATDLVITGVVDGPLSGGTPKAVEFFALAAIPDLSLPHLHR